MKINRIMALALACVMLFVTGCNNKNNAPDKDGDNTPPNSEKINALILPAKTAPSRHLPIRISSA